jgi:hypothetical protein
MKLKKIDLKQVHGMVSGHATIKFIQEGISFGFDGIEIKPVSIKDAVITKVEPTRSPLFTKKQHEEFKNGQ